MNISKAELQKMAAPMFERFGVKKLFGTTDGQIFLLESRASLHAGSNLTVYALEKEEKAQEPEAPAAKTATATDDNTGNQGEQNPGAENTGTGEGNPGGEGEQHEVVNLPLSVKALTEKANGETDLEVLKNMLLDEVAGPNRKSAVAAIEKRLETLTKGA